MSKRLPLYVLLASALTFLASLYLPWVASTGSGGTGPLGLLNLFAGGFGSNGWGPFGQAGALLALTLAAGATELIGRPRTKALPLFACSLALLYLAIFDAVELRADGLIQAATYDKTAHLASGAYVGLVSASVACLAAAALRRDELARRPSAASVAAAALTAGLLAAFLWPWLRINVPRHSQGYQIAFHDTPTIFASVVACLALPLWIRGRPGGGRRVAAVAVAVLTGGYLSQVGPQSRWPWEPWLALGCSLALVALALLTERRRSVGLVPLADLTTVAACVLLVGALFPPWQKGCSGGVCISTNGWSSTNGAMAGGLAVLLAAFLLGARAFLGELALGVAVFVGVTGSETTVFARLGYGAALGFAGAALLLLSAARRLRPLAPRRLLIRAVPIVACAAFLAIPIAALTGRLSLLQRLESPWRLFWLGAAAIILALRLLERWLSNVPQDRELVLLPLGLLALTALDLIYDRGEIGWEGWATVVLCLLLVALGWIERNGGLEKLRIPEELRIDRLPEAES